MLLLNVPVSSGVLQSTSMVYPGYRMSKEMNYMGIYVHGYMENKYSKHKTKGFLINWDEEL